MSQALLVAVEGVDRSGKSTLVKDLVLKLQSHGQRVVRLSYPNRQNQTGQLINRILRKEIDFPQEAMYMLFSANRWEDSATMQAALSSADVVVCDRYTLSGLAYALASGANNTAAMTVDQGLTKPDLVLFLADTAVTASTRPGFGEELFEKTAFQASVHKCMLNLLPNYAHVIITGTPAERLRAAYLAIKEAQSIYQ
ncbi:dTMP kinase [Nematocida homosporus]|uniref:dTMP kinase n=1 Tax=Nematocida homosporus TaxID=1912981 RepID=UPI00221FA2B9|nr:dTMP kinase [Nematocida homosporus]KAI5184785.1 dTMP kinase [Nematocida homosporus]